MTKEIKDFDLPYKLSEQDLTDNPEKARTNFINNLNACTEFRLYFWDKLYSKKYYRKNFNDKRIDQVEQEWSRMNDKEKLEWYDWFTDNDKDNSMIKEIMMIQNLLIKHKGNMKRVFSDIKVYGKQKKLDKETDN